IKKAKQWYDNALKIAQDEKLKLYEAEVLFKLAIFENNNAQELFKGKKEAVDTIVAHLKKSADYYTSLGKGKESAEVKKYAGKFFLRSYINRPKNAAILLEEVLIFADAEKDYGMAREVSEYLADAYDKLNDDEKAEYYRSLATSYTSAVQELLQKKEELEKNQRFVLLTSVSAIFFLVLSVGAYFAKNKISKQKKLIQLEKEKSESLLLNILPQPVAEELKKNGSVKPQYYASATVIFTDFKGFTNIAEQLSPTELVKELDICFKAFDEIVEKYHVERIKTIGDAYMCVGGVPIPNDTHPKDCVEAALEMLAFIEKLKTEKQAKNKPFFEIRIGIHTGKLVAGVIGTKKFAYDVWGDTVNIAARMEQSGEAGRINISKATYEKVKKYFDCEHRGKIAAKNKGEIDMYFVLGKKA
ncbi:MAG: adenylate/guanylate cyclase domain-containing protein, partial [Flammeovirgaceae bacterium]|nr:adenylate/guanylate cyclase domain-containing protein [Flammeovirgaceae bacterium]MDW8287696.1 adenylate/guanylate cyclase domain-containing protein [Flammeovirgaceae bacterium]